MSGLQSIAWHEGALWAIQGSAGELRVVRIRLNASGTRATRVETFGHVSSEAATLSGGVYYVLAHDAAGGVVVRAIDVRKVAASR